MATCHKCGTRKLKKRYCKHCGPLPPSGCKSMEQVYEENRMTREYYILRKDNRVVPGVIATNEHRAKLQAREREEWNSWELMLAMGYRLEKVRLEAVDG